MYAACLVHRGERAPQGEAVTGLFLCSNIFWAPPTEKWVKKGKVEWFLNSLASVFVLYVTSARVFVTAYTKKNRKNFSHHSTAPATTKAMRFLSLHRRIFSSFLFLMLRPHTYAHTHTYIRNEMTEGTKNSMCDVELRLRKKIHFTSIWKKCLLNFALVCLWNFKLFSKNFKFTAINLTERNIRCTSNNHQILFIIILFSSTSF